MDEKEITSKVRKELNDRYGNGGSNMMVGDWGVVKEAIRLTLKEVPKINKVVQER